MKNVSFFLLVMFSLAGTSGNTQSIVKIAGLGKVSLPAKMEIQGGAYKDYVDAVKEINGVSASNVIFQQKGLNSGKSGFDTYARVMFKTIYGDFETLSSSYSQQDVRQINDVFKQDVLGQSELNNASILSWNTAVATTLNGYKSVRFGYKRKIGSNPVVNVQTYLLQNNDRMYLITFEGRTDSYNWQNTFQIIKNSIIINK